MPPETHEDNNTAENKIRICHWFADKEQAQPGATDTVSTLDNILTGLRQGKLTQEEANQQADAVTTSYFTIDETKTAFAEAVIAIKNYTAD